MTPHKPSVIDNFMISLGERLIQYASEYLVTEVLISPQLNTLQQCMKNMLGSFTKHRHILHGGYTFAGTCAWVLKVSISNLRLPIYCKRVKMYHHSLLFSQFLLGWILYLFQLYKIIWGLRYTKSNASIWE